MERVGLVRGDAGDVAINLIEALPDPVFLCRHGVVAQLNAAARRLLGDVEGRPLAELLHSDYAEVTPELLAAEPEPVPMVWWRPGGGRLLLAVAARPAAGGTLLHARDIAAGLHAAAAMLRRQSHLRRTLAAVQFRARARDRDLTLATRVFQTTSEGILVLDGELRVTAANPAAAEITGRATDDLTGHPPAFLTAATIADGPPGGVWEVARTAGRWQGEVWSARADGDTLALRLGISAILDVDGSTHYVVVFSDITRAKQDEERFRRQATYDSLTNLPNRALFLDRLALSVHQAERARQMVGLMFIDLDGFKLVNDTLGHHFGDLLLQETAHRLSACVRSGDTVARLGGDEFTVLMPNLGDYRNAPRVAQRILEALRKPFDLAGKEAFVSGSIGITVYPDDAVDAATMLKNADAAMYRAKEQGKANYQFFTADMNAAVEERLAIKNSLSKALENDELALAFQPKLDLALGRLTGVEALLRWTAADLGMVAPAKFIPVMEETGLINRVGEWALVAACRQHRQWRLKGLELRVAVNLSVRQLRQPGFVDLVRKVLAEEGVGPEGLAFEITESMIMNDTENAIATLKRFAELGIELAMDDFGTGYSSLSYLKRFPVDAIKIDRGFIADIATDADGLEIIRTIISMGHSLRRRVVAEGVETPEQARILKELGCDEIQGYLLSPPVPPGEIPALAHKHFCI